MALIARTRARREMTALARLRRRIQHLGPYQSLVLLIVPVGLVEPLKIVALFVAGKGHWLSGTAMIIGAYVVSLFFVFIFARVNSDDDQLVRVFLFQLFQIGNHMEAVNAAIGPEVQKHNLAFETCE